MIHYFLWEQNHQHTVTYRWVKIDDDNEMKRKLNIYFWKYIEIEVAYSGHSKPFIEKLFQFVKGFSRRHIWLGQLESMKPWTYCIDYFSHASVRKALFWPNWIVVHFTLELEVSLKSASNSWLNLWWQVTLYVVQLTLKI